MAGSLGTPDLYVILPQTVDTQFDAHKCVEFNVSILQFPITMWTSSWIKKKCICAVTNSCVHVTGTEWVQAVPLEAGLCGSGCAVYRRLSAAAALLVAWVVCQGHVHPHHHPRRPGGTAPKHCTYSFFFLYLFAFFMLLSLSSFYLSPTFFFLLFIFFILTILFVLPLPC